MSELRMEYPNARFSRLSPDNTDGRWFAISRSKSKLILGQVVRDGGTPRFESRYPTISQKMLVDINAFMESLQHKDS